MRVAIEPLNVLKDGRGFVLEPMTAEELSTQKNVHVVITLPGFVRGNHYHPCATEMISVVGPALVRYREGAKLQDVHVAEGEAVRFTFPPGVSHAIQNTGNRSAMLIAFLDMVHHPGAPDMVQDMLIHWTRGATSAEGNR